MSSKRVYRSTLREAQAQQTRLKIRRAARQLFVQRGFPATTVADIAAEAGVSSATVYAVFESKAGIVSAMLEEMEEVVDLNALSRIATDEHDPRRQLRFWAAVHCSLFTQGADVLRAAMQVTGDPEVRGLIERGDGNRRAGIDALVRIWHEAGSLRPGLSEQDAGERMWLLTTVDSFLTAIDRLHWSPEGYEVWLVDVLDAELFGALPN